jgi:hypothetical protein
MERKLNHLSDDEGIIRFPAKVSTGTAPGGVVKETAREPAHSPRLTELPGYGLVAGFILIPLILGFSGPQPVPCETRPTELVFGFGNDAILIGRSGVQCRVPAFPGAGIDNIGVGDKPESGTVSVDGNSTPIYRSKTDFHDRDAFAFAIHSKSPTFGGMSIVRVHVNVR